MRCDKLPSILGVFLVSAKDGLTYMGEYATHLLTSTGPASFGSLAFEQTEPLSPGATWWPMGLFPDVPPVWLSEKALFTPLLGRGDGRIIGFVTRES